ncbi:MAG TPA: hypothetical protein VHA52_08205, partial [Candidatus Babeliaceae bacterium]|nr:hypothetical protein [Candidatus Babeliaceae bacterium]
MIDLKKILIITGTVTLGILTLASNASSDPLFIVFEKNSSQQRLFEDTNVPQETVTVSSSSEGQAKLKDLFNVIGAYSKFEQTIAPDSGIIAYGKGQGATALLYALDANSLPRLQGLIIDSPSFWPIQQNFEKALRSLPILFAYDVANPELNVRDFYNHVQELYQNGFKNLYLLAYSNFQDLKQTIEAFYQQYGTKPDAAKSDMGLLNNLHVNTRLLQAPNKVL